MKKTVLSGVILAACLLSPVLARSQALQDPTKIEGGTFTADTNHTQVEFSVLHLGFTPYFGRFSQPTGTLSLSPTNVPATQLSISVPTATVSVASDKLTQELKGEKWFDVAKYPTMSFVSTKTTQTGPDSANVTGDLTLHGVTKPITLAVHFVGAGTNLLNKAYTVGFQGTGTLKRSDFGLTTLIPYVGDEVTVTLAGAFERKQ